MNTSVIKLSLLGLLTAAILGTPLQVHAQNVNAVKVEKQKTKRKVRSLPLHGKLKKLDLTAKTLTIGRQLIQITPDTKFTRAGEPAKLKDGVIGEETMVLYTKTLDGKKQAVKVRFGPKVGKKKPARKSKSPPNE